MYFFCSSRRRHTRWPRDWSSDVCSSDLLLLAVVLHGAGGMDEASLSGENHLVLLNEGNISQFTVTPDEVGLPTYDNKTIQGGNVSKNAKILLSVLKNEASPFLDTTLLNAGIGLFANGKVNSIIDGVQLAREVISSGAALERLETLRSFSQSLLKEQA